MATICLIIIPWREQPKDLAKKTIKKLLEDYMNQDSQEVTIKSMNIINPGKINKII